MYPAGYISSVKIALAGEKATGRARGAAEFYERNVAAQRMIGKKLGGRGL